GRSLRHLGLALLLVARSAFAGNSPAAQASDVPRADTDKTVPSEPDAPLALPQQPKGAAQQSAALAAPPPPTAASWPRQELPVNALWDGVAVGVLGAATLVVQFGVPNPSQPKSGSTGFDDWVRGWLKISSEGGRNTAALTSDVFVFTLAAAPFVNAF